VALLLLFSIGLVGAAVTTLRLWKVTALLRTPRRDVRTVRFLVDVTYVQLLSALELSIIVMCSNTPGLAALIKRWRHDVTSSANTHSSSNAHAAAAAAASSAKYGARSGGLPSSHRRSGGGIGGGGGRYGVGGNSVTLSSSSASSTRVSSVPLKALRAPRRVLSMHPGARAGAASGATLLSSSSSTTAAASVGVVGNESAEQMVGVHTVDDAVEEIDESTDHESMEKQRERVSLHYAGGADGEVTGANRVVRLTTTIRVQHEGGAGEVRGGVIGR
jgi:hypothetical protein